MLKKRFLLLLTSLISSAAMGINEQQKALIAQPLRPTPEQILSDENNFEFDHRFKGDVGAVFSERLPSIIVGLEKAFPGARYAFLGRDMDLIADAVEAFYLTIGQSDRVARIRFSTPSMQNATPELITDFLVQTGLNTDPSEKAIPYVIVDYTSYGNNSQSRILLESALQEMNKRGILKREVLSRLNIVSINPGPSIDSFDILEKDKPQIEKLLKRQNNLWVRESEFTNIATVYGKGAAYAGSDWHDRWGPIVKDPITGEVNTSPLAKVAVGTKKNAYFLMTNAINMARSPEFLSEVASLAKAHKVKFEGLVVSADIPHDPTSIFKRNLQKRILQLRPLSPSALKRNPFNTAWPVNGRNLRSLFQDDDKKLKASEYLDISMNALLYMYDEKLIGDGDFRELFTYIFGQRQLRQSDIPERIQAIYKDYRPLEIMLGHPKIRETYTKNWADFSLNYNKITNGGNLPLSCKFLLLRK